MRRWRDFSLSRLCIGTLGLSPSYSPSQMKRVLDRAAAWLIECGCLQDYPLRDRAKRRRRLLSARNSVAIANKPSASPIALPEPNDTLKQWLAARTEAELWTLESAALESAFGSELERTIVAAERTKGVTCVAGGRIRQEYVRRYAEHRRPAKRHVAVAS
jgi:hypothetical protein